MKKSNVLFLSFIAALASVGAGALYLWSPARETQKSPHVVAAQSPFRKALAEKGIKMEPAANAQATAKPASKATASLFFKLAQQLPTPLADPIPAGVDVKTLPKEKRVLSSTVLDKGTIPNLASLKKGQVIGLPLPNGSSYDGLVNLVKPGQRGAIRVGGSLMPASEGSFSLSQHGVQWQGMVRLPAQNLGYVINTWPDGRVIMQEHLLSDLECLGMPAKNGSAEPQIAAGAVPQEAIPLLNTRPGAKGVLYLDFDGETVTDANWNSGNPIIAAAPMYNGAALTNTHITQVVQAVAEDYAPFDVTITTDRTLYDNTAVGKRMRCIITPTQSWYGGSAAGVAYLDSFSEAGTFFDDDVPCWCFGMYDAPSMALVISHELGHTFGLSHDGTSSQAYYGGHGSGATSWGPIMGAPYSRTMTQWSIGEYYNANNTEDDVAVIANATNGVDFVPDDGGNDIASGVDSTPPNGQISLQGILSSSNDPDFYKVLATAAPLTVTCTPSSPFPNADVTVEVYAEDGTLVGSGSSDTSLAGTASVTLSATGNYYIAIFAAGNGSVFTGYSNYGSIGAYTLTGSFTTVPSTPEFVQQPVSLTVIEGATATLSGLAITTGGVGYQWYQGNNPYNVAGAQSNTLKLTSIKPGQAGMYKLLATNATNATFFAFSNEVMVTVNSKPKIITPPAKATVLAGTDHTFTVVATGTGPLMYTWEKNNVALGPPSANPDLTLVGVDLGHAGNYRVKVTNPTGVVVVSPAVALKVDSPPVITKQPAPDTAIPVGGSTTLKIVAAGNAPFTYQWFMMGDPNPINKATTASLMVKAAGTYYAKVFNAIGGLVGTQSSDAVVVVHAKPVITLQPVAPAGIPTGEVTNVDLTVAATGGGTLLFQWQKDGKNITLAQNATANSATLSLAPIHWTDRGVYKCIVSNRVGTVTSKTVTIKVDSAPVVITQPLNPTYGPTNGGASFTVVAGGSPTLKFQWYFNTINNPIAKATASKLSLTKLTAANEGMYFCRISNTQGGGSFVDSAMAELIVDDLPKVLSITSTEAANKHKVVINGSITLSATTSGLINTYQWLKGGKALAGKTQSTLVLSPAQVADSGSYTLQVTNNVGKATSAALAVAVLLPPVINQVPLGVSAYEASAVSMSVKASGSPTLKFQWEKSLPGGGYQVLIGKVAPTLTFASVTLSDAGVYHCVVTNDVGSATSLDALLSVQQVPPATIGGFLPARGRPAELVRITGTNFQHIASAKFGTLAVNTFTIVSDTEILLTVPNLASGAVVEISLTSKGQGGTVSSGAARTFTRTPSFGNDAMIDARIMNGTNVTMDGDNYGFTNTDVYDYRYASAWYWWIAPRSGIYRLQIVEGFDSVLVVFSGRPDSVSPSYISYVDGTWGAGETTNVTATAGQSFLFQVSSWYSSIQGPFGVYLNPVSFTMATPDMVNNETPEAPANVPTQEAVRFGTGGAAKVEPISLVAKSGSGQADAGKVRAYFKMGVEASEGPASDDSFEWTLRDQNGRSVAGLSVGADGALESVGADGSRTSLQRSVPPGTMEKFEFILDQTNRSWTAKMGARTLFADQAIPAGSVFDHITPTWNPGAQGSPHATLIVEDIRVLPEAPGAE